MDAAADIEAATFKRSCSPTLSRDAKRLCFGGSSTKTSTQLPSKRCLHCDSAQHTWYTCTEVCKHCFTRQHVQHRCPRLDVEYYMIPTFSALPSSASEAAANGDFVRRVIAPTEVGHKPQRSQPALAVLPRPEKAALPPPEKAALPLPEKAGPLPPEKAASALEGVSSDRLAMIAITPPEVSEPVKHGDGPLRSGMNSLPLGPRSSTIPSRALTVSSSSSESVGAQYSEQLSALRARVETTRGLGFGAPSRRPADRLMGSNASSLGPPPTSAIYGRPSAPAPRLHAPSAARGEAQSDNSALHGVAQAPTGQVALNMTSGAIELAGQFRSGLRGKKNVAQYGPQNMGIWTDLASHVQRVVQGAMDPGRVRNNGFDGQAVGKALQKAHEILRPLILRDKRSGGNVKQKQVRDAFTRVLINGDDMEEVDPDDVDNKIE